ncbi:MAG TPA: hypothetical protein VH250_04665 [Granulicella sp.]|nr:hypothetical protein [Granulicella sp.]
MADNTAPEQLYRPPRETVARAMRASNLLLPSLVPAEPPRLACDPDRIFNLYALHDLRGLSQPPTDRIGQSPTYIEALRDIEPVLTQDDQRFIANAKWAAALMAKKVVSDFQNAFGDITPQDLTAAHRVCGRFIIASPQDYVMSYVLAYLWSGSKTASRPPLSLSRLAATRHLEHLLPAMPPRGAKVVADVAIYLSVLQKVSRILINPPLGAWIRAQIQANSR